MEFTGERFVPGTRGQIKLEHLQRYGLCRDAVRGKRVLDIACGEGYGSSMLAATARRVLGVDVDPAAVEHARMTYGHLANVEFLVGTCDHLRLPDGAFDVVVSFETIEHHAKHAEMIREVRRVLAPGGLFIMSSPNKPVYACCSRWRTGWREERGAVSARIRGGAARESTSSRRGGPSRDAPHAGRSADPTAPACAEAPLRGPRRR